MEHTEQIKDETYWEGRGYNSEHHDLVYKGDHIIGYIAKPSPYVAPRIISKRSMLARLTPTEKGQIHGSDKPEVKAFLFELSVSANVNLDFPEVRDALNLLVYEGILEQSRIEDILKDPTPQEAL